MKKVIFSRFLKDHVLADLEDRGRELLNNGCFGTAREDKLQLSLLEALYLLERGDIVVKDGRGKILDLNSYIKKAQKEEPRFSVRYAVYKDMRKRGYVVKTALKFGADFRVYDRGIKPGEDHAKWVVFAVNEGETLTWHEFAAKNRVAHSTRKRLLLGIVDDEGSVTYYEVRWMRP